MFVCGVDENGLGPWLGPLVATAVTIEVERYDATKLRQVAEKLGIGDSKQTSAFGAMRGAESLTLALFPRATSADELFAELSVDSLRELQRSCPKESHAQCWTPLPLPAFGGTREVGQQALAKLPVAIHRARSAVLCASAFNREVARLSSKFRVDLNLFERLIEDAHGAHGELRSICGMIGGIRKYPSQFVRFSRHMMMTVEEVKGASEYRIEPFGHVRFEVDADATHVPVALASMVGKYVRELWMHRQNLFYQERDASLAPVSGYHDPRTKKFVLASTQLRASLAIADDCFLRNG